MSENTPDRSATAEWRLCDWGIIVIFCCWEVEMLTFKFQSYLTICIELSEGRKIVIDGRRRGSARYSHISFGNDASVWTFIIQDWARWSFTTSIKSLSFELIGKCLTVKEHFAVWTVETDWFFTRLLLVTNIWIPILLWYVVGFGSMLSVWEFLETVFQMFIYVNVVSLVL